MNDLPEDREKALEAIAKGWGREPSFAHPDCICLVEAKKVRECGGFRARLPCPVHSKAHR